MVTGPIGTWIMKHAYFTCAGIFVGLLGTIGSAVPASALDNRPSVAFLGVRFNDNERLEPTTDAEKSRITRLGRQFTDALSGSEKFTIIAPPDEMRAEIANSQNMGACGGCDVAFGKRLGAERVAWVTVQKVSNLILNMNVYMADVGTDKITYVKSVDIRGNTDESWSRSMKYLLDNYLLNKAAFSKSDVGQPILPEISL